MGIGIGMGLGQALLTDAIIRRSNRWIMVIPTGFNAGGRSPNGEFKALAVRSVTRPSQEIASEKLQILNEEMNIPKNPQAPSMTVVFLDFVNAGGDDGSSAVYNWANAVYNFGRPESSGKMSDAPAKAMKDCVLYELDGEGNKIGQWEYFNCWISKADYGKVDYTEGGKLLTIQCTIQYQSYINSRMSGAWGGDGGSNTATRMP